MAVATQSILFDDTNPDGLFMSDANFGISDHAKFSIYARVRRNSTNASGEMRILSQQGVTFNVSFYLRFLNDSIDFLTSDNGSAINGRLTTTATYTDTTEWISILVHFDSANATAGDRMRMWVGLDDGDLTEVTSFSTDTNPTTSMNNATSNVLVGVNGAGSTGFDGLIYQLSYFDGVLVDPTEVQDGAVTLDTGSITGVRSVLSVPGGDENDDEILSTDWTDFNTPIADNEIPPYLKGSASGTSTASGVGASEFRAVGSSTGTSTASGVGASEFEAVASSSGSSTASAVGETGSAGVGSSAGTSTASAVGESTFSGVGVSAGSSTASAVGASEARSTAESSGVAVASGVGASNFEGVGSSNGTSTASAVGQAGYEAIGSASGTSTASGVGASEFRAVGSSAGFATSLAIGASEFRAVGSASGLAVVNGVGDSEGGITLDELDLELQGSLINNGLQASIVQDIILKVSII